MANDSGGEGDKGKAPKPHASSTRRPPPDIDAIAQDMTLNPAKAATAEDATADSESPSPVGSGAAVADAGPLDAGSESAKTEIANSDPISNAREQGPNPASPALHAKEADPTVTAGPGRSDAAHDVGMKNPSKLKTIVPAIAVGATLIGALIYSLTAPHDLRETLKKPEPPFKTKPEAVSTAGSPKLSETPNPKNITPKSTPPGSRDVAVQPDGGDSAVRGENLESKALADAKISKDEPSAPSQNETVAPALARPTAPNPETLTPKEPEAAGVRSLLPPADSSPGAPKPKNDIVSSSPRVAEAVPPATATGAMSQSPIERQEPAFAMATGRGPDSPVKISEAEISAAAYAAASAQIAQTNTELAAANDKIARLEAKILELSASLGETRSALQNLASRWNGDMAQLQGQAVAMNQSANVLQTNLSQQVQSLVAQTKQESQQRDERLAALEGKTDGLAKQLEAPKDEQRTRQDRENSPAKSPERKVARVMLAQSVLSNLGNGVPLAEAIAGLSALGVGAEALAPLTPFAVQPPPTTTQWIEQWRGLRAALIRIGEAERTAKDNASGGNDDNWYAPLLSKAKSLTKVERIGDPEGDTPNAQLARIDAALSRGDASGALDGARTLPEPMRRLASQWIQATANLLQAKAAAQKIQSESLAELTRAEN